MKVDTSDDRTDPRLATMHYLGHALPAVAKVSRDAAMLVEVAMRELAPGASFRPLPVEAAGDGHASEMLCYALPDVEALQQEEATALRTAIHLLRKAKDEGEEAGT